MKTMIEKLSFPVSFVLLLAFMLLRGLQGLNMWDDGFSLTSYSLIFSNPSSVAYMFLYYWTEVVGGVWNVAFGSFGIYGFRVFECVVLMTNALLVYRLARPIMPKWCISLGLIMAFSSLYYIEVFEYNSFTGFVALIAVSLMVSALQRKKPSTMFIAGIVLGFCVFVRIPNVCLCGMILVLIPYYIYTHDRRSTIRQLIAAICGFALGILSTLAVIWLSGTWSCLADAFDGMITLGSDRSNTHGLGSLVKVLLVNNGKAILPALAVMVCPCLSLLVWKRAKNSKRCNLILSLLVVLHIAVFLACHIYPLFLTNGLPLLACVYVIVMRKDYPFEVYTSTLALLVALLMPCGSDAGTIPHNLLLAWAFVPYALVMLIKKCPTPFLSIQQSAMAAITFALLLLKNGVMIYYPSYYETHNCLENTYKVNHPKANVYTDKHNSEEIDQILVALDKFVKPGDPLLVLGNIPMLHYLTDTHPYLYNPWPWIFKSNYISHQMDLAAERRATLPMLVCELGNWRGKDKSSDVLRKFVASNKYSIVYNDKRFIVFSPPKIVERQ